MLRNHTLKDEISDRILNWIVREKLREGDKLLSEKKLASQLGVNHLTVRKALSLLESDDYIERVPKSGTYVKTVPENPLQNINEKLIAVVLRNEGDFHKDLTDSICRGLQTRGYLPMVIPQPHDEEPDRYEKVIKQIEDFRKLGGAKLVINGNESYFTQPLSLRLHLHHDTVTWWKNVIWIDGTEPPVGITGDIVKRDTDSIMDEIINHLKKLEHQRIAYLTHGLIFGETEPVIYAEGITRFCFSMSKAGLGEGIRVLTQTRDPQRDFRAAIDLFTATKRPTAVVADGDFRLVTLMKMLEETDLNIPEELAMVGNFNTQWADHCNLTSVQHNIESYATEVVRLLQEEPEYENQRRTRMLKSDLVFRQSSTLNPTETTEADHQNME